MLRCCVLLAAGFLLLTGCGSDPTAMSLKESVADMADIAEDQGGRALLEKWMHPDELAEFKAKDNYEANLTRFDEQRREEFVQLLRSAHQDLPDDDDDLEIGRDGEYGIDNPDGLDIDLVRTDGRWYLTD